MEKQNNFNGIRGINNLLKNGFVLETAPEPEISDEALLLSALDEARETINSLEIEDSPKVYPPSKSAAKVTELLEKLVLLNTSGRGVPVGTTEKLHSELKKAIDTLNFGRTSYGLPPKTSEELLGWYADVEKRLLADEIAEREYVDRLINSSIPPEGDQQWDYIHSSDRAWLSHCQVVADRAATSTFPDKGLVDWFESMVLRAFRKLDPKATGITRNEKALARLKDFLDYYEAPVCRAGGYDAWWALRSFWFRSVQAIERTKINR